MKAGRLAAVVPRSHSPPGGARPGTLLLLAFALPAAASSLPTCTNGQLACVYAASPFASSAGCSGWSWTAVCPSGWTCGSSPGNNSPVWTGSGPTIGPDTSGSGWITINTFSANTLPGAILVSNYDWSSCPSQLLAGWGYPTFGACTLGFFQSAGGSCPSAALYASPPAAPLGSQASPPPPPPPSPPPVSGLAAGFVNQWIVSPVSGLCWTVSAAANVTQLTFQVSYPVYLAPCVYGNANQIWTFASDAVSGYQDWTGSHGTSAMRLAAGTNSNPPVWPTSEKNGVAAQNQAYNLLYTAGGGTAAGPSPGAGANPLGVGQGESCSSTFLVLSGTTNMFTLTGYTLCCYFGCAS